MKLICRPCTWWAANLILSDDQHNNEEALRMPLQPANPEQQHLVGTSSSNKKASTYIGNRMTIKVFRHLLRRVSHRSLHETHSFIVHDASQRRGTNNRTSKCSQVFTHFSNHSLLKAFLRQAQPDSTLPRPEPSKRRRRIRSRHKQDNAAAHSEFNRTTPLRRTRPTKAFSISRLLRSPRTTRRTYTRRRTSIRRRRAASLIVSGEL